MKVSVLCEVYNQIDYIRSCLDGIVMQKTDFPFEVLVHDDASTDGTEAVIREYEEKYPDLIVGLYETENQYSKGVNIDTEFLFPRAKGIYLAFCEGDDYWTDEYKLQKQVDALDRLPEIDICAHASSIEENGKCGEIVSPRKESTVIPVEDVIKGGGGFVSTASLMFRADINRSMPEFRKFYHNDYSIQIQGSLRGGMYFLKDVMCVYRCLAGGSWSSSQYGNREKKIRHAEDTVRMLELLDSETDFRYQDVIRSTILFQKYEILKTEEKFSEMMEEPYQEVYALQSFPERMKIRLKRDFPVIWKARKNMLKK